MSFSDAALHNVFLQLDSDKVKGRQDAIATLRKLFSGDRRVKEMDSSDWGVLFTKLHASLARELATCTKKGARTPANSGTAALRRLGEVAATIRWLTERSVSSIRSKKIIPHLQHLLKFMKHRGGLLDPVAIEYIKAIRAIVSWSPHLEFLEAKDQDTWLRILETGFNVILEDPLKKRLEETEGEPEDSDSPATPSVKDSPESSDEEDTEPSSTNPRKRRVVERKYTSRSTTQGNHRLPELHSVTLEQVEFTSVLAVLLKSETAPLLSPDMPYLPAATLDRLSRFLLRYPGDSTLHHDYLHCLSGALSHLALNKRKEVTEFSRRTWNALVGLWGTRTQRLKEELTIVLRTLLPYLTAELSSDLTPKVIYEDSINNLWKALMSEADRRSVEGLSLDCLRLQVLQEGEGGGAFVARTFRHGWHFDSSQALSWAILSLQTDCAEQLYYLSESVHSSTNDSGKRVKRENPITSLVSSISSQSAASVRTYRLQSLLFFIDRHWLILHEDFRRGITQTLHHYLSLDDPAIQSWTFLCLAAIGLAESTAPASPATAQLAGQRDTSVWNNVWTHAMRRTTVPAVSRAACHTAYTLLLHSKTLLSPQQVLAEIETMSKDLDVQGPSLPYESTCSFLVLCMRVASHDVRLYRMQLEEKVLAWLMDAWRPGSVARTRMPPYTIEDILNVLASICCTTRKVQLLCPMKLPDCPIANTIVQDDSHRVIRDYLLRAHLPPHPQAPKTQCEVAPAETHPPSSLDDSLSSSPAIRDLAQPRGRERRISAFLLKSVEELLQDWETTKSSPTRPSAERTRSPLDVAVVALLFEAILSLNGTRPNKRVQQAASKLLALIIPVTEDARWTSSERALILSVLEPLVLAEDHRKDSNAWQTLLSPSSESGIRQELLKSGIGMDQTAAREVVSTRRELQRLVFQSSDVQGVIEQIQKTLHQILRTLLGEHQQEVDANDGDHFSTVVGSAAVGGANQDSSKSKARQEIVDICVTSLAVLPTFQSSFENPTRDKELFGLVCSCELESWLIIGPAFVENVRQKTLRLSHTNLQDLFHHIDDARLLTSNVSSQVLIMMLLEATAKTWFSDNESLSCAEVLCIWLCNRYSKAGMTNWICRDRFAQFLDSYLTADPAQSVWSAFEEKSGDTFVQFESLPSTLLPQMGGDPDIRVRFRAAVANARLVRNSRSLNDVPMNVYGNIRKHLSVDLDDYEYILTRLLCLGNIVVVSSAVRRGPLWHLLEICLHSQTYTRHVEALLAGVAQRLSLSSSSLFEAYASQIAYSLRQTNGDFLQLPAHLLGYRDKRECAEATFEAFTPTNVLAGGKPEDLERGRSLFKLHCQAIKKTPAEGIGRCFAEIVGYQIVSFMEVRDDADEQLAVLDGLLKDRTKDIGDQYGDLLKQYADGVVATILCTLGDQDFSPEGPILKALQNPSIPESAAADFKALSHYRHLHAFEVHEPNLPAFSTTTILRALQWFKRRVPSIDHYSTTYHVLHQLFADLGRSPLVNEQMRLVSSISLWASLHRDDFHNPTILSTFINGATNILPQPDLARAAQSLLEWGFSRFQGLDSDKDPRLTEVLIRISCTAHDYLMGSDPEVSAMGREILKWLEEQALGLCHRKHLKRQVVKAFSVWPAELSESLRKLSLDADAKGLSTILNDGRVSSNKFRLVRRLRDLASHAQYDESLFSRSDFWALKECIPTRSQLSSADLDAFCDFITMQKGLVNGLGSEQVSVQTVRTRHAKGVKKQDSNSQSGKRNTAETSAAQQAIVVSLLGILQVPSVSQVQLSYSTLKSIVSVLPLADAQLQNWSSEFRQELSFLKDYFRPFKPLPSQDVSDLLTNQSWLDMASDFPKWVSSIASLLSGSLAIQDPFYTPLTLMLRAHPEFAEQVFPALVHTALQMERSATPPGEQIRNLLSDYFGKLHKSDASSVACRRTIVDTVLHLRHFTPSSLQDPMRNDALCYDKWLDVNYLLLSKNAIMCGAYTTALLFVELAAEYTGITASGSPEAEEIMYDIYSHIDEPDGFYGINTNDLQRFLIKRFHHEKQWDKAFQFHGAKLETRASSSDDAGGVVRALHSFGFDHLAMNTLNGAFGSDAAGSSGMTYQLGWRTEVWDLPEQPEHRDAGSSLYLALRAIYRERDSKAVNWALRRALVDEVEQLAQLGRENLTGVRQVVQNLMCLNQVVRWQEHSAQQSLSTIGFPQIDEGFEFQDLEAIMAVRLSLLRSSLQKERREQIGDMLTPLARALSGTDTSCLLRLSQAARQANQTQIAMNAIVRAQNSASEHSSQVMLEFANVLWLMKEPKLAIEYLRKVLRNVTKAGSVDSGTEEALHVASGLARLGNWTSDANLEKPALIVSEYFDPAVGYINGLKNTSLAQNAERATIYHHYAIFSEQQYQTIAKSPDALRLKLYIERRTQQVKELKLAINEKEKNKISDGLSDYRRDLRNAEALLQGDQFQFQAHAENRDVFLAKALEMHSRALETSDQFDDDSAIRLCSLWFSNFNHQGQGIQKQIGNALRRVPSRKFVFLAHQISARMSGNDQSSVGQDNLRALITRMCREHPFHSLYQVWCLQSENSHELKRSTSSRRLSGRLDSTSQSSQSSSSDTSRANAAATIFDILRNDQTCGQRVREVEELCRASLEWAKYPIKHLWGNRRPQPSPIPSDASIRKIRDLHIPVMTVHTPIDPTLSYENCVLVASYDPIYDTAGGLNLPKISQCIGTDGVKYKQLFKGEGSDDLRQDAVMEQVFELVNIILRRDRETRKRNLSVRGYKVIPLASQAGVVEFVGNTTPLGHWLTAAHQRYRPNDLSADAVRSSLQSTRKASEKHPSLQSILTEKFVELSKEFQPVMRHYFTERHKTPMSWFRMRLNYARSVATTSIVGHLLGLGDRHTSNILLDNGTGEVVHIDLGIAFEQGKLLPIPERVPFRLTRDMVDGLGTSGTQGVFQRCAEETLRVLRDGSSVIVTVLEVFKYDPLHSWTASDSKVKRVQGTGIGQGNTIKHAEQSVILQALNISVNTGSLAEENADRALNAVSRKLDKSMTVEYTVNELIAEATDVKNLANMFAGWAPHY